MTVIERWPDPSPAATTTAPRRLLLHLRATEALELAHPLTESKQAVAIAQHVRQAGALTENRQLARYLKLTGKSALEATAQDLS